MGLINLGIVCVLAGWPSGTSSAQCQASIEAANAGRPDNVPASVVSAARQSGEEDRTVVVELVLRKSGAVRSATVAKGATIFREAAIKAVKKRNYKNLMYVWPFQPQITVEVKFPQDTGASPEIRQVLPAGVGCLPAPSRGRVFQTVMANRLLSRVEPVYPSEAQSERVAGVVVVRVVTDKSGEVSNADYVSGPPALVPAAIKAVKQWKYQPYLINGESIEVETTVEISFTL